MSDPVLDLAVGQLPGSLRVDDEYVRLSHWPRDPAGSAVESWTASHPSGLRIAVAVRRFIEPAGVEWATTLSWSGQGDSPRLSELRPLDLTLPVVDEPTLSTINGSLCQLDDFLPWQEDLGSGRAVHLEPTGGRSSDGAAPFFVVDLGTSALGVAIGWSGQWAVDLTGTGDSLQLSAGLAGARLRLRPGESITLPSILLVASPDGAEGASTALRRVLEQHVIPHRPDGSVVTPLAHMTMSTFHRTQKVSEASELAAVQRTAEVGLEAFWVDACWYGDTPRWAEQVGNWNVRTADFPNGLRPISDAAHRAGLDFVVWMEPERARADSRIVVEHPTLFLPFPDQTENLLLDLGHPEARDLVLELISGYVDEFAVDVYRQDFNIRPLPAWQAADEPGRAGIHEIRHIEGLYWLWDRLRERHPPLVIDNCASGGRRIDLETLRRSVPLWRSDAADVGGGASGDAVSVANQVQVSGLSRFVTQHTGPVWSFDPYSIRSGLGTGFVVYCPLPTEPEPTALLRGAIAEVKRLRPFLTGDFYVLAPPGLDDDGWCALQFHRPSSGDGLVVLLRRPGSSNPRLDVAPRGVDPAATYRVTMSASYDRAEPEELSGDRLAGLSVEIDAAPGSLLVEYARLR